MLIIILEFIFYISMLPIAIILTILEVLIKVLVAMITGKRQIKSFFASSYARFGYEISMKCKAISEKHGGGGEK